MNMAKYFYDKDADVFYFSEGVPRASDETIESADNVLLRVNPRTKKIRGFTLLNASRRVQKIQRAVTLPFTLATIAS